ncbi:hypothetical protein V6N11_041535 [Hibiscus sabdariffa]|uniref:UBL3-like ubiquitin domain-containing protein n=1 Tax=Hibiscus sabdariffa TaxID=183260 RepID=A0ABR2RKS0_9ROSI
MVLRWDGQAVPMDQTFQLVYKTVTPKSINNLKLIHAGKVLENNKSLADSRITFGDLPAGVITMHVVVQPAIAKNKTEKSKEDMQKPNSCRCVIL